MKKLMSYLLAMASFVVLGAAYADGADKREFVQLPEMMQSHMMANMRDHLAAINEILTNMAAGELDQAADIAEQRIGMSSLDNHGAHHMAKFMPKGMRQAGMAMHKAANPKFFAQLNDDEARLLKIRESLRRDILRLANYNEKDPNFRERFFLED